MELKKNTEANLEKKRPLFFLIGFVVALSTVLLAFEWTEYEGGTKGLGDLIVELDEEEMIPITQQEKPPPPPKEKPPVIEIVEDEEEIEEELEVEDTEIDEDTEVEAIEEEEEEVVEEQIFTIVEDPPSFPGGEEAMFKYLSKKLKYPAMAKESGISGIVYVNFLVDKDGKIKNVKILRGIGGGCDQEAQRVVENMPSWKPGRQRGKAVKVSFNLPVRFTLR